MRIADSTERRDPVSGLIRLGTTLTTAGKLRQSGLLKIEDQERIHLVKLFDGKITETSPQYTAPGFLLTEESLSKCLFSAVRPKIIFEEKTVGLHSGFSINTDGVILRGVIRRTDLFEPRVLSERIPMNTLKADLNGINRILKFSLSEEEKRFVEGLARPTPVVMAIWKRGLAPRYAGAWLVALNLMGVFPDWSPGDLPRVSAASMILKKLKTGASAFELLGVLPDTSEKEIDRAFRKQSFNLHPDRFVYVSETERTDALTAFEAVSNAYNQLKNSRRKSVVRTSTYTTHLEDDIFGNHSWKNNLEAAEKAVAEGRGRQAAALALKALSMKPPQDAILIIKSILRRCA